MILEFVQARLKDGCRPAKLQMYPLSEGRNEVRFYWYRHWNSQVPCAKFVFNVSDAEYKKCLYILNKWQKATPIPEPEHDN
jgi:hypothetical protein